MYSLPMISNERNPQQGQQGRRLLRRAASGWLYEKINNPFYGIPAIGSVNEICGSLEQAMGTIAILFGIAVHSDNLRGIELIVGGAVAIADGLRRHHKVDKFNDIHNSSSGI